MMSVDVNCPYCGAEIEIKHDDGYGLSESELHNQQCGACDRYFAYTTIITVSHSAYKADCLNDGQHQYEKTKTIPARYAKLRCSLCGDEKPLEG